MNKLLLTVYFFSLIACAKDMPSVSDPWAAQRVNREMIISDTGTTWKITEIYLNYAEWNADSNRYYDFYYDTMRLANQEFSFKNLGADSGSYKTTETVAKLLRIPNTGTFVEKKGAHTSMLILKVQRDTVPLQVGISKREEKEVIIPGKYQLVAIYTEGDIWHRIELSLSPG